MNGGPKNSSADEPATDAALAAVDDALATLGPIEPSAQTVAQTLAAISVQRRSRVKGLGIGLLVAAAALAIITPLAVMKNDAQGPNIGNVAYAPPEEAEQRPLDKVVADAPNEPTPPASRRGEALRQRYRLGGQEVDHNGKRSQADKDGEKTPSKSEVMLGSGSVVHDTTGSSSKLNRGPNNATKTGVVDDIEMAARGYHDWADSPTESPTESSSESVRWRASKRGETERLLHDVRDEATTAAPAFARSDKFKWANQEVAALGNGRGRKGQSLDELRSQDAEHATYQQGVKKDLAQNKQLPPSSDGVYTLVTTADNGAVVALPSEDAVTIELEEISIEGRVAKPFVTVVTGDFGENGDGDGRFGPSGDATVAGNQRGRRLGTVTSSLTEKTSGTLNGMYEVNGKGKDVDLAVVGTNAEKSRSGEFLPVEKEANLRPWKANERSGAEEVGDAAFVVPVTPKPKFESENAPERANADDTFAGGLIISDELDRNSGEDFDGYMDHDGIPDPDNDGDGILDPIEGVSDRSSLDGKKEFKAVSDKKKAEQAQDWGQRTANKGRDGWGFRASGESKERLSNPVNEIPASGLDTQTDLPKQAAQLCRQAPQHMVDALTPPHRDQTEGLTFRPATGYYENTYVPGDPRVARLQQAVSGGLIVDETRLSLAALAEPVAQPFDAPDDRALAVFLSSDAVATEGPVRMTLQIGIKGAERAAARRASLNLALVVDLASIRDEADRQVLWSMADALANARQTGDRFTLVTAGLAEVTQLAPDQFSNAEVRRVLAEALERYENGAARAPLASGMHKAYQAVANEARAGSLVGANLVLLATGRGVAGQERQSAGLDATFHQNAVAGIHTSVLVTGSEDHADHARWAQMGQGRRRFARNANAARQAVDRELTASGRAVARAVRLRIRLAEGVRLVEVIGSRRLDAVQTDRVKAAEKAIDVQVAATTGIAADRGEDEDGIQIIIPAFYAADDHVILLDVVADAAGPIADVQARYKDLVRMENGVETASLSLVEGPARPASPRVLNVAKNRFAAGLSATLRSAGGQLFDGDPHAAVTRLAAAGTALTQFRTRFPGLRTDAALAKDEALLAGYATLMCDLDGWVGSDAMRQHIGASLVLTGLVEQGRESTSEGAD